MERQEMKSKPLTAAAYSQRTSLLWSRYWLAILVLFVVLVAGGVAFVFERTAGATAKVQASWRGNTLWFSSIRGFVVVTHLVGTSGGAPVGAALPAPLLLLDSGGASVPPTIWKSLRWLDEGGAEASAPPVGSEITGLYQRQNATEWKAATEKR